LLTVHASTHRPPRGMQCALGLVEEPPDAEKSLTRSWLSGPALLGTTDGGN
jgi:hypothetical protein